MTFKIEVADDLWTKETGQVGGARKFKAWNNLLRHSRPTQSTINESRTLNAPAHNVASFKDAHRETSFGKVCGRRKAVVSATHYYSIVLLSLRDQAIITIWSVPLVRRTCLATGCTCARRALPPWRRLCSLTSAHVRTRTNKRLVIGMRVGLRKVVHIRVRRAHR